MAPRRESVLSLPDHIRVGDDERSEAVDRLTAHAVAGRLSVEELEQRIGLAHGAVRAGDLYALETDLPRPAMLAPRHRRRVYGIPIPVVVVAVALAIGSGNPVPVLLVAAFAWRRWHYAAGRSTRARAS